MAELSPAMVAQMASITEAACQRAVAPVSEAMTSMERRPNELEVCYIRLICSTTVGGPSVASIRILLANLGLAVPKHLIPMILPPSNVLVP